MAKAKQVELTPEQEAAAATLTKLQRETVINIECYGMSQVKAYQAAGGKSKGKNAEANASRLLSFDRVIKFRATFVKETLRDGIMSRDEALERLSKHARIKITDICDFKYVEMEQEDGEVVTTTVWTMKNAEDIDPDVAACIKSVAMTKNGPKIELYDANGSIKLLADMQGWNAAQKHLVGGADGGPIQHEVKAPEIAAAIKQVSKFL